jgi:hypothetical protein
MAVEAVDTRLVGAFGAQPMEAAVGPAEATLELVPPAIAIFAPALSRMDRTLADLFALNILLQIVDGILTYNALQLGFAEGNPLLAASFMTIGPLSTLCLFKAKACGLLLLVRRSASPAIGTWALQGTAVGYALLAIVPWIGKLCVFAALNVSPP